MVRLDETPEFSLGGAHQMIMSAGQMIGLITLAVLLYGVILLTLWKQPRPIKWLAVALITVGLGYLATTSAPESIAQSVFGRQR